MTGLNRSFSIVINNIAIIIIIHVIIIIIIIIIIIRFYNWFTAFKHHVIIGIFGGVKNYSN